MKNRIKSIVYLLTAFLLSIFMPVSVYALDESMLEVFSQNNVLFYDPGLSSCEGESNGIWKGEQYNLSEDEILGIARVAKSENSCNLIAFKKVVSIIANLYEFKGQNYSTIVDYMRNGGWFGSASPFSDDDVSVSNEQLEATRDVLVNGNRVIPPEILEYDCIGDLEWLEVNGTRYNATGLDPYYEHCEGRGLEDKSLYVPGETKIHNRYGSTYIFYGWAGDPESDCGDSFGYFENNPPSGSYSQVAGSNVNYSGAQVFSDAEMQAIEENKAIYQEAAEQYNFPWQIMAVLHSSEHGLLRTNPDNGQGIYQLYSYTDGGTNGNSFFPAGEVSEDEFRRQTIIAAGIVNENARGEKLDLNKSDDIKRLFFKYNGTSSKYIDKAIQMGFTEEQARNGEGSAYVMNRYDAQRDPTSSSMSPLWPGRYTRDNYYDSNSTSNGFGTFVKYEALAGSGGNCVTSGLKSGGMSLAEAREFMQSYRDLASETRYAGSVDVDGFTIGNPGCYYGALANCVAVSKWFLAKYTDIEKNKIPYGDGKDYVRNMINAGFEDGGHTPRAYAIFSRQSGGKGHGHTGVVLGIDTENNKIIIGEAGCYGSLDFINAHEYSLDVFSSNDYIYAYTDNKLIGL